MSAEKLADALRVEVGLLVSGSGSLAADESRRNYMVLRGRGIEHDVAKHLALRMTAETLEAHARVASIAQEAAAEYRRCAALLRAAIREEHAEQEAAA